MQSVWLQRGMLVATIMSVPIMASFVFSSVVFDAIGIEPEITEITFIS